MIGAACGGAIAGFRTSATHIWGKQVPLGIANYVGVSTASVV
ncbi:MAG: hypothetical protein ACLSBH_18885 [Coprobacillus cateniformis]